MALKIVAIIAVILCSLSSKVFCRQSFVEQHETNSIKVTKKTVPVTSSMDSLVEVPQPITSFTRENCKAVVQTIGDGFKKFKGSQARVGLYAPQVQSDQWSSGRIKLSNGNESIEAGWMVNPGLFKDNYAHLYQKFSAGGKECINHQCPGFIEIETKAPLGLILSNETQRAGITGMWALNMTIEKRDGDRDGYWWLSLYDRDETLFSVGVWPKSLFTTSLSDFATQIEWGGEIYNPGPHDPRPDMGSGYKADDGPIFPMFAALFYQVTLMKEDFRSVDPDDTQTYANCKEFYNVVDKGYLGPIEGRILFYGGKADRKL